MILAILRDVVSYAFIRVQDKDLWFIFFSFLFTRQKHSSMNLNAHIFEMDSFDPLFIRYT